MFLIPHSDGGTPKTHLVPALNKSVNQSQLQVNVRQVQNASILVQPGYPASHSEIPYSTGLAWGWWKENCGG